MFGLTKSSGLRKSGIQSDIHLCATGILVLMRPRTANKQSGPHPLRQGIAIAALILIIFWFGSLILGLLGKAQFAWNTAHETEVQAAALRTREHTLQANIATLATPRGREAAVRTAFGVARPGEQVIIVVPPPRATTTPTTTPWWRRTLGWFGL